MSAAIAQILPRRDACRDSLRVPAGNRLEDLKDDRWGQHSIRVNDQWCICFVWTEAGPENVTIYAASKAALAGVTVTLDDQLADAGITLNTVNPGPVDTGCMTSDVMGQMPHSR